jgi:hypothetical protein
MSNWKEKQIAASPLMLMRDTVGAAAASRRGFTALASNFDIALASVQQTYDHSQNCQSPLSHER